MPEIKDLDLVSKLSNEEETQLRHSLNSISPDDGKYRNASLRLQRYLSEEAERSACADIQRFLLETRVEFGHAKPENLSELKGILHKIDPLNIALIESQITRHDQLAVIEEIGRHVSPETKALLHPGTTSYDILDTARAALFRNAWADVIRPEIRKSIEQLCNISEETIDILQVGRTHLKNTSPIPFGLTSSNYAARIAERTKKLDQHFDSLKGKISGIVGTSASIDTIIGNGKSIDFELAVLKKLELEPDYTATQIVQKETLADVGHGLTTIMYVLKDFADDIRFMYSSAIEEVTSRDSAERLGGSSADAGKNNPIDYENISGKTTIVESGMRILYDMISTNFQRDLRSSVEARYQPQSMMVQTYESFTRLNKALKQLSLNTDSISGNLQPVRDNPSEAMTSILRREGWIHSKYGPGHDFVKEMSKNAKKENKNLLEVSLIDLEFSELFYNLHPKYQEILKGKLELYTGSSETRAQINRDYARKIFS